jgi:uncharacterized membrane protein YkoI
VKSDPDFERETIMFAKKFAELSVLLALSIVSMPALARESGDTTKPTPPQQLSESDRAVIFQEIKLFSNVNISVRDVIAIAEKRAVGAKVVDVSFDGQADRFAYRVKTYQQDEIWEGTIDAGTGKILGEATITPVSMLDAKDRVKLAGFRAAGIDLSDVAPIAEKYGSGKAVSAGLEEEDGRLIFLVVVVADGSLIQISVDPNEARNPIRKISVRRK